MAEEQVQVVKEKRTDAQERRYEPRHLVAVILLSVGIVGAALALLAMAGQGPGPILFQSNRDGDDDIFTMNLDGTNLRQVTHNIDVFDGMASWSPDGTRIVYTSGNDTAEDIFLANADGGYPIQLTRDDGTVRDTYASWSPDGTQIVFASDRDGDFEIYTMKTDGDAVTQLTFNDAWDGRPAWSPDGTLIAFQSGYDGDDDLYVMNADGSNIRTLVNTRTSDGIPAWSPDGTMIAFESDIDGDVEIYVIEIACLDSPDGCGEAYRQLTDNYWADRTPSWSPDGNKIIFHTDQNRTRDIYIMDLNGQNIQRLTDNEAEDSVARWRR